MRWRMGALEPMVGRMSGRFEGAPDAPLPVWVRHLVTIFVWGAALALVLYFLDPIKIVFLGFLATAALAAAVRPLMKYIPGPKWLRALLAGIIPILVLVVLIGLTAWLLAGSIAGHLDHWRQVFHQLNLMLAGWSAKLQLTTPLSLSRILTNGLSFVGGNASAGASGMVTTTADLLTKLFIALIFVFFGVIYLLYAPRGLLLNPLVDMLPPRRGRQLAAAVNDLEPRLWWWVIGAIIAIIIIGVASGVGFLIVGLNLAIPLALLAGTSEIVPTVGPAAAFMVALLFAALQGWGEVFKVAGVWACIHVLEGQVVHPLVMKRAVRIPPVVTLFTAVLWGEVFGLIGLLLAIPINLTIWTFAEHFLLRRDERPDEPPHPASPAEAKT